MISSNPLMGTLLHGVGGVSAASCYLPFQKIKQLSWNTYWLVQATFAWLVLPLVVGYLTVPDLAEVFRQAPQKVLINATLLGMVYGFGGMAFGYAIKNIGYSLTYTISIGLSAVLGTIIPLLIHGTLIEHFSKPGGMVVLTGMLISFVGVFACGWAGYRKEQDLKKQGGSLASFNIKKGLPLAVIAGVLSAIFGVSLEVGAPVAEIAAANGAGHFEGNANLILSTGGTFITNFCWFFILSIRQKTIREIVQVKAIGLKQYLLNMTLCIASGAFWYLQFFFYGLGHVRMGNFKFASWAIHMTMLVFFSYLVGVLMKEWKGVSNRTYQILITALCILVASFMIITYGSMLGSEEFLNH
ncbi:L-rhamnose/proton symporter RhaT [Persicobacter diffluens]|uniref:Sugar:proton symporter n=1 Tax=Persicobacter diffluens TaxID=981 RepID=A0AAN4W0Z1_9BACT|nr:sugar:proton symporter [Persicobacter diffluens]